MKTQLSKWGNSLAVPIPKAVADAAHLRAGDDLHVEAEGPGAVRVRKLKHEPTLPELVRAITLQNCHVETDGSKPVSDEVG